MQLLSTSLVLAACAAVLPAQMSGTHTIDPTGPFPTFQSAANAVVTAGVSGPVTFLVLPGTYTESVTITQIPGASAANTVTFRAIAPGTVRLVGATGDTFALQGIATARTGWIVFDGLDFDSAPGYAISGTTYVEGIEIRNCTFGPNHRGPTRDALIFASGSGSEVGWDLHHNSFTFPDRISRTTYGVYMSNVGDWSFHDNVCNLNGCNYGLYMINQNRRLDVVYNNVFYGSLAPSTSTSAASVAVIKADISNYDNDFVHNTFFVTVPGTGCCIATRGLSGGNATNRIYGNVFHVTGAGTCIVMNPSTSLPNPYLGDGNVFFAPGGEIGRTTTTGPGITTLAAWQAATGQDAGSAEGDPLFRNVVAVPPDLRVQPGSPALDRAVNTPAYVTGDLLGRLRGAQPDAGAHEGTSFVPYGTGCPGTNGLVPVLAGSGTLGLGQVFFIDLQMARANSLAIEFGGLSRTMAGPTPLPFAIGGGCLILAEPLVTNVAITDGGGAASIGLFVPNNAFLLGTDLFFQWAIVDAASGSPFGIATSNGGALQL